MSKLAFKKTGVSLDFYLEVSERLAFWARWGAEAAVWLEACRDMVWGSDLSLWALENTGSPLIHTGTAEGRQGDLYIEEKKKDNLRYWSI